MAGPVPISLRPFVKLWFTSPHLKELKFHLDEDKGIDKRFSHITDFEFEEGDGDFVARFTLVDYQYKITDHLLGVLDAQREATTINGGVSPKEHKKHLRARFFFGWHTGGGAGNPWKQKELKPFFGDGEFPQDTIGSAVEGILDEANVDISEGIYKYTLTFKGNTPYIEENLLPDIQHKDDEKNLGHPNQTNVKELLDEIFFRCGLTYEVRDKMAEQILVGSKINTKIRMFDKPINVIILEILNKHTRELAKRNKMLITFGCGRAQGDADFIIGTIQPDAAVKESPIRTYIMGVRKNNAIINFSPNMPKELHRLSLRVGSAGQKADGENAKVDNKVSKSDKRIQALVGNVAKGEVSTTRESPNRSIDEAKQMARQWHWAHAQMMGFTAELTILGDPGIRYLLSKADGRKSGKYIVRMIADRFPYIDGGFGDLHWVMDNRDDIIGGKYIITKVAHSMGAGRPYETTMTLTKLAPNPVELSLDYKELL